MNIKLFFRILAVVAPVCGYVGNLMVEADVLPSSLVAYVAAVILSCFAALSIEIKKLENISRQLTRVTREIFFDEEQDSLRRRPVKRVEL